jgi:hypothetical protein
MFDMTAYVEVSHLLEQVAEIEERLSPNERELFRSLKAKYAEPGQTDADDTTSGQTDADDTTCLEVMLRNVRIRQAHGLQTGQSATRAIEMTVRRGPPKD